MVRHLVVLACYLVAGVVFTWPRASYLWRHLLPSTRDASSYVWDFWWIARQVTHLSNPWFTRYLAAPVGAQLAFHTLMPLPGVLLLPVTVAFGPSASYNLLSILLPGLLCYALYRAARLWLRSETAAIAAGALFGLSSMLTWLSWYLINLAAGAVFLPLALEAAVRLRRSPRLGQAMILGAVLGAALLTDQESAILALLVAGLALLPWVITGTRGSDQPQRRRTAERSWSWRARNAAADGSAGSTVPAGPASVTPFRADSASDTPSAADSASAERAGPGPARARSARAKTVGDKPARDKRAGTATRGVGLRRALARLGTVGMAAAATIIFGSPQIAAMLWQWSTGGASANPGLLTSLANSYTEYGTGLTGLFAPSPRVAAFGLTGPGAEYYRHGLVYHHGANHQLILPNQAPPAFGIMIGILAVAGLIAAWRRRSAWLLALLALGAAALALGPTLWIGTREYVPFATTLHGVRVSAIMPFTWFVQIPGLQSFREADRLVELGLLATALLAGSAIEWLRYHARPVMVAALALCVLELGWTGNPPARIMPASMRIGTMPTAQPRLDRRIAADHSHSIVADFPFGIRGGGPDYGPLFAPAAQLLETADGHPRAIGLIARAPGPTISGIASHPFYAGLIAVWHDQLDRYRLDSAFYQQPKGKAFTLAAKRDAARMDVGWVVVWPSHLAHSIARYLAHTGFRLDYQVGAVKVYRRAGS